MLIDNNVEGHDLGGGVVLFRRAISFDVSWAFSTFSRLVQDEIDEMFQPTTNPETGEPAYVNRSGYLFSAESVDSMPKRGSAIHRCEEQDVKDFLTQMEAARDRCLLKYFELYPYAYNCVWWKVKGHLVSYGPGVYLGSHSDISAEYVYGVHRTPNELALRNVVSCLTYLNSSLASAGQTDFTDGHHYFDYLDIDICPEAGDILFFPSNYVAVHQVKPVGEGRRLSYLGWYSQGTPNQAVGEDVIDPLRNPLGAQISTNVYMPTLREDYRAFLLERGYDKSSVQYRVTKLDMED